MLDNFQSMVLATIVLNIVAHLVFSSKIHNAPSDHYDSYCISELGIHKV